MWITRSKGESWALTSLEKLSNLLGLAQRAGALISGEGLVIKAIQKHQTRLVFLAHDAAPNLTKKVTDKCQYYDIEVSTVFSALELSVAIGRSRKVLAVTDAGFAKKMRTLMN